jgi:hypothetical protein
MRRLFAILILGCAATALAQSGNRRTPPIQRISPGASGAEAAIKGSIEALTAFKKLYDRDVEVLNVLRAADDALADNMQPSVSIQKAYESVTKAHDLHPDFLVDQGVIKAEQELEAARRSPISADFGRLRTVVRTEALGPATRVVARDALRLQEETVAWLRVQEMIASHVRVLSEITGEGLRAAQQ